MTAQAAFYTVADSRFFLGLVALLNSLRLVGHREPLSVLDCGLEPWQREALSHHAHLVAAPPSRSPILLKQHLPLLEPADVMIMIDADMMVVRRLDDLVDRCRTGESVIAFVDGADRFHAEWGHVLGLTQLRREPYVNSGLFLLSGDLGREVLRKMQAGLERIHLANRKTFIDNREAERAHKLLPATPTDPFFFPEQDVLNAVLSSEIPEERQLRLDARLAPRPPFSGLRLIDTETLRCEYEDRVQPYVLHHVETKPWQRPTPPNVYSDLLPRLLLASDLELTLQPRSVPLRFRPGASGSLERARLEAVRAVAQNDPMATVRSRSI